MDPSTTRPLNAVRTKRPELIFALVGPAGVNLDAIRDALGLSLAHFGYTNDTVRVSALLELFDFWTPPPETGCQEYQRIKHFQDLAFKARKQHGADVLARAAIQAIRECRANRTGSQDSAAAGHAYILQQLKHPSEALLLRRVYGSSFILLAGHASRERRIRRLAQVFGRSAAADGDGFRPQADAIVSLDEKERRNSEPDDLGQNVRDAYPLADLFVDLEGDSDNKNSVSRFVELLFGHPFRTPTHLEAAMFQASAVALRSSDEGRQVGAVIVDERMPWPHVDIVASGMNEVPRAGGGYVWEGMSPDSRNQAVVKYEGRERGDDIKHKALREIIERIRDSGWLIPNDEPAALVSQLYPKLKGTQFMDIGEFMSPVHAEMAALLDAARRGVSVDKMTMYVTSFPCHNCAKHILAAGLERVVYLEPYPKSRAGTLHGEEIDDDPPGFVARVEKKVPFARYSGVAPRQYATLFSMPPRGGKNALARWEAAREVARPLHVFHNAAEAYLASEREMLAESGLGLGPQPETMPSSS